MGRALVDVAQLVQRIDAAGLGESVQTKAERFARVELMGADLGTGAGVRAGMNIGPGAGLGMG